MCIPRQLLKYLNIFLHLSKFRIFNLNFFKTIICIEIKKSGRERVRFAFRGSVPECKIRI